ncbi:6,7-dimethyl-8-ribityllumazine synthase [Cupriavidus basilensis]
MRFIHAQWHADIVHRARDAFLAEMAAQGISRDVIDVFEVPGAFEIPLHASKLAATGRYAAIVASAFVVDGGIYRHEVRCRCRHQRTDAACSWTPEVPVLSAVLTPKDFHEHEEHRRFFSELLLVVKGKEAAQACVKTVESLGKLVA